MENWHDLTSGIDLPRIQRTFGALFGYILTLLLDPVTVDQVCSKDADDNHDAGNNHDDHHDHHDHHQLAPPLLDLLGVSEEDHHFLQIDFLPAIRHNRLDC